MEKKRAPFSVLVVDDEETTRWGLVRLLSSDGFITDEACDGRKALEKISLKDYDVVITDLQMPLMDGLDFIKAIKETSRSRIIVMTAYGNAETYYKALDFGAIEYINKPIEYENLLELINEVTREKNGSS